MGYHYLKKGGSGSTASTAPLTNVSTIVKGVIDDIRENGDSAVRKYSEKFDQWSPESFKLSQEQIDAAIAACPKQTIDDIKQAQANVRAFAQAQKDSLRDFEVETQPVGGKIARKLRSRFICLLIVFPGCLFRAKKYSHTMCWSVRKPNQVSSLE